jgi:hypothetical protein
MNGLLTLILAAMISTPCFAEESAERLKIAQLLEQVESSGCTFFRNDSEHNSTDAAKHLRLKLDKATSSFFGFGKPKDVSAKAFIDKIASESSMSGKPYKMKCGTVLVTSREWLNDKLKLIESDDSKSVK